MLAGNHRHLLFGEQRRRSPQLGTELLMFQNAHQAKVHHASATLNNPYRKEFEFVNHTTLFQGIWSA